MKGGGREHTGHGDKTLTYEANVWKDGHQGFSVVAFVVTQHARSTLSKIK